MSDLQKSLSLELNHSQRARHATGEKQKRFVVEPEVKKINKNVRLIVIVINLINKCLNRIASSDIAELRHSNEPIFLFIFVPWRCGSQQSFDQLVKPESPGEVQAKLDEMAYFVFEFMMIVCFMEEEKEN